MSDQLNAGPVGQAAEEDLRISMSHDRWVWFEGTAAQLLAEGLFPEGFEWPQAEATKRWQANGFAYFLRPSFPKRLKGSKAPLPTRDSWNLCMYVPGRGWAWTAQRELDRKIKEALADYHLYTDEGCWREFDAWLKRVAEADSDKAFQAFKQLVPGLARPKRSRKAKSSIPTAQGAQQ